MIDCFAKANIMFHFGDPSHFSEDRLNFYFSCSTTILRTKKQRITYIALRFQPWLACGLGRANLLHLDLAIVQQQLVFSVGKGDLRKVITLESPLCEVILEGNKIQLSEELLRSPTFKGISQEDVNIFKTMAK